MPGYTMVFKPSAQKQMSQLNRTTQLRIAKKLQYYLSQSDPLGYAVKMADSSLDGQYRFRIGDYRIIFDVVPGKVIVLKIQHRRDIYKR
jgi:mRNA interferase RelE/StbE